MSSISIANFIRWQDIIDIIIVSILIYNIIIWLSTTRAKQLFQGLLFLLGLYAISNIFQFYTIDWLLEKFATILVLVIIIVFQPELRHFLERLGRTTRLGSYFDRNVTDIFSMQFIQNLTKIVEAFANNKVGTLIVIEQINSLDDYKDSGIHLNADFSPELLGSIFYGRNPLHDGAVIINGNKIDSVRCLLPLTETKLRDKGLGTRHHAALGLAEQTDAIVIVTSEETGIISLNHDGKMYRKLNRKKLSEHLLEILRPDKMDATSKLVDRIQYFLKNILKI